MVEIRYLITWADGSTKLVDSPERVQSFVSRAIAFNLPVPTVSVVRTETTEIADVQQWLVDNIEPIKWD
jgi:hypothetical protein